MKLRTGALILALLLASCGSAEEVGKPELTSPTPSASRSAEVEPVPEVAPSVGQPVVDRICAGIAEATPETYQPLLASAEADASRLDLDFDELMGRVLDTCGPQVRLLRDEASEVAATQAAKEREEARSQSTAVPPSASAGSAGSVGSVDSGATTGRTMADIIATSVIEAWESEGQLGPVTPGLYRYDGSDREVCAAAYDTAWNRLGMFDHQFRRVGRFEQLGDWGLVRGLVESTPSQYVTPRLESLANTAPSSGQYLDWAGQVLEEIQGLVFACLR